MDGYDAYFEGLSLLDIGVAAFDRDLRLIYCNPAFLALRRYPAEVCHEGVTLEALLRFNAERGDFGAGDAEVQVAERLKEIGQSEQRAIEREMADGQILRIRYRRTGTGGMLVTYEDRTEENRARRSLAASEERHMLVARATSDGIYDWDVTQDQLYVSDRLGRILDIELGAGASGNWADRVHPDDYQGYRTAIRAHFKAEAEAIDCEYRVRARDGGYRWIHDRGVGVRNESGRVVRLVGAVRDITEIKEAKAELDRSEARLVASLATISDGILLVDADKCVQLWNERYYEIFSEAAGGADLSAIIAKGRPFFDMIRDGYEVGIFKPHPDGVEAWVAARKLAWDQSVSQWELELSNGRWILLNERRMPDGGRASVYTDITALKEREAEAQAARQRFEEAIEAISAGFALFDADDRLVAWNSRFREYFRWMADVFTPGAQFRDMLTASIERGLFPAAGDDPQGFLESLLSKRAEGLGQVRENMLNDGLWLQIRDHRTKDGGLVSIYTDVTELKTSEQAAQAARQRFEEAIGAIASGFVLWDAEDRLVTCNARFREIYAGLDGLTEPGTSYRELINAAMAKGMFPNAARDPERYLLPSLEGRNRGEGVIREQYMGDGRWLQITDHRTADGGLVSIYTDVTELKTRQQEAQAARDRFEEAIEAISSGFALWDSEDRLMISNSRYRRYFADLADMVTPGKSFREVMMAAIERGMFPGHEGDAEAFLAATAERRARASGEPREQHLGEGLWLQITDHHTAEGGIVSIYTDVTELKNREAEITQARDAAEAALADLRKAQARLVQAEKMASLGQLTAGIAHEIKNPLNFVNNFAKLSNEMVGELAEILDAPLATLEVELREEADELLRTVRENLVKITEHGKRADSIVRNMLMHAREGPSERQAVGLNAIAEEALNLAYHGARAEHPGFNIEMMKDLSPEIGEVECYPQDLMRVFLNLISNGMYAANKRRGEAGAGFSPKISLATRPKGDKVEIEVRDNGTGIPPELRERIFLPFFTTKPAGEGTGLGLSLSYDIVVEQHEGDLTVESEPGEFTAFRVLLPRRVTESERGNP